MKQRLDRESPSSADRVVVQRALCHGPLDGISRVVEPRLPPTDAQGASKEEAQEKKPDRCLHETNCPPRERGNEWYVVLLFAKLTPKGFPRRPAHNKIAHDSRHYGGEQ